MYYMSLRGRKTRQYTLSKVYFKPVYSQEHTLSDTFTIVKFMRTGHNITDKHNISCVTFIKRYL